MKNDKKLKEKLQFNYNYIFFNGEDNKRKKDPRGYYAICAADLEELPNLQIVSSPLDYSSKLFRLFFGLHNSRRINNVINLPFKKFWYPFYFKTHFDDVPLCFVVYGNYVTPDYLKYLKKKYPKAKFVKIYRDLIKYFYQNNPQFSPEFVKGFFDMEMTYDEEEAKTWGINSFVEFESKTDIPIMENYPICDVFFAGKAKDRLDLLMETYHKLTSAGLKCNYYLTEVPKECQIPYVGIEYASNALPYYDMLCRTVNSRCVLEINQHGTIGYTSRFLEAVIYSKKLITNNLSIKKSHYYEENYILCFENVNEIDSSFVNIDVGEVNYHYVGDFSPIRLFEQIDKELITQLSQPLYME